MRIRWRQSPPDVSALDELLRAIEYAEARATSMGELHSTGPAEAPSDGDHAPPKLHETRDERGSRRGRDV